MCVVYVLAWLGGVWSLFWWLLVLCCVRCFGGRFVLCGLWFGLVCIVPGGAGGFCVLRLLVYPSYGWLGCWYLCVDLWLWLAGGVVWVVLVLILFWLFGYICCV